MIFFFNDTATTEIYTLSLHDALPIFKGLHFKCAAEEAIIFAGGTNVDLRLIDCTFESTNMVYADAKFLYGQFSGGGTQHIENCRIKDFGSWYLLDAATTSATPTVKLDSFVLKKCKIENCAGSMVVRGMQADPNGSVSFVDNLYAFGAGGQETLFWDCFEANNTLRVICTGNTVTGAVHGANRGFLQAWSRSSVPWMIRYRSNTIANFGAAVRVACNATFYSPNSFNEDYLIKASPTETDNVTYATSYVYPYTDATKTYAPENSATFPSEPVHTIAGLSNFVHA